MNYRTVPTPQPPPRGPKIDPANQEIRDLLLQGEAVFVEGKTSSEIHSLFRPWASRNGLRLHATYDKAADGTTVWAVPR